MNTLIPSVTVNLDGTDRRMYYDVNAHIAFEEAMGTTLLEAMQVIANELKTAEAEGRAPKMPSVKMIRTLLWAGLRSDTLDERGRETADTLSEHQIGSMLDFAHMMDHLRLIGEAFNKAMQGLPETNPPKAPRQKRVNRSTGSSSGASHTNSASASVTS
jgi:hypothetical protein